MTGGCLHRCALALVLFGCGGSPNDSETTPSPITTRPAPGDQSTIREESVPESSGDTPEPVRDDIPTPFDFRVYRIVEESPEDYQQRRDALLSGANPGEETPSLVSRDIGAIVPVTPGEMHECAFRLTTEAQGQLGRWHRAATTESFVVGLVAFWGSARHELRIQGEQLYGPCPQGPPSRRLGTTGVVIDVPASFPLSAGGSGFRFANEQGPVVAVIYPADATHVEGLRQTETGVEVRHLPLRRNVLAVQRTSDGQTTRFVILERDDQFWVCTSDEASRYCDSLRSEGM